MDTRTEAAALWCVRAADGPLDGEGQAAFDAWLAQDPENWIAFEEASALWESLDQQAERPEVLAHRAKSLEWLRSLNRKRWAPAPRPWRRWVVPLLIAAAFVLSCMATLALVPRDLKFATGVGERQTVALEDGSRVSLDATSSVDVRYDGSRRNLTLLAGRAKFDVAKDAARPFTVMAGDKEIVATGTSFSVELLDGRMRVILYEGHVAVLQRGVERAARSVKVPGSGQDAGTTLRPGTALVAAIGRDEGRIEPTDLDRSLSWEMGLLDFRNEPLAEAVARLNRYADRKLVIDDEATATMRIDGVFRGGDMEAFVDNIASLYPVAVVYAPDAIHLRKSRA